MSILWWQDGSSIIGSSWFFPWKMARNLICWWYAPNFIYSHENMSYFSRYTVMPSFFAGKYFQLNWIVLVNHSHFQTAIASISTIIMMPFILSSHFGWWIPLFIVTGHLPFIGWNFAIHDQYMWWFLQLPIFYKDVHVIKIVNYHNLPNSGIIAQ